MDNTELRESKLDAKDFSFNGETFEAKVVSVYDGDTARVKFRWAGRIIQYQVRMMGYDSPEMKPLKTKIGREKEIAAAKEAKKALLGQTCDGLVTIACGPFDKYGRILVTMHTEKGENINQWMMNNHYGVPYDGGTKTQFVIDE
jgi:endonuclease YncB( thermonuclease family)